MPSLLNAREQVYMADAAQTLFLKQEGGGAYQSSLIHLEGAVQAKEAYNSIHI